MMESFPIGSESINQALIGGVRALHDSRRTIIASCFEHPAVNETLKWVVRYWHDIDSWKRSTDSRRFAFK